MNFMVHTKLPLFFLGIRVKFLNNFFHYLLGSPIEDARKKNPCIFIDVSIGDDHAGKMVFEVWLPY
jgi:hypothetical protein